MEYLTNATQIRMIELRLDKLVIPSNASAKKLPLKPNQLAFQMLKTPFTQNLWSVVEESIIQLVTNQAHNHQSTIQ